MRNIPENHYVCHDCGGEYKITSETIIKDFGHFCNGCYEEPKCHFCDEIEDECLCNSDDTERFDR